MKGGVFTPVLQGGQQSQAESAKVPDDLARVGTHHLDGVLCVRSDFRLAPCLPSNVIMKVHDFGRPTGETDTEMHQQDDECMFLSHEC